MSNGSLKPRAPSRIILISAFGFLFANLINPLARITQAPFTQAIVHMVRIEGPGLRPFHLQVSAGRIAKLHIRQVRMRA
jgi:hypothetical protein